MLMLTKRCKNSCLLAKERLDQQVVADQETVIAAEVVDMEPGVEQHRHHSVAMAVGGLEEASGELQAQQVVGTAVVVLAEVELLLVPRLARVGAQVRRLPDSERLAG